MDIESALKAVETIRSTVPPAEQQLFDAALAMKRTSMSEAIGVVSVHPDTELSPSNQNIEELMATQLHAAYLSYFLLANKLNEFRSDNKIDTENEQIVAAEFDDWFTDDRQQYVVEAMGTNPELRFTLVATPNVIIKKEEIFALATQFCTGDSSSNSTTWNATYARYADVDLSGTNPDNGNRIKFSLVPNQQFRDLPGTAARQRRMLEMIQTTHPFIQLPSLLEVVAFWQTHVIQPSDSLHAINDTEYNVRHFNLTAKQSGDVMLVPETFINPDGLVIFGNSDAYADRPTRLSIG